MQTKTKQGAIIDFDVVSMEGIEEKDVKKREISKKNIYLRKQNRWRVKMLVYGI